MRRDKTKDEGAEMSKEELENIVKENQIDKVGQEILKKLYVQNNDVLLTINFEILSERFTRNLSFEEISRIVCDPEFQESLVNLDDSKCNLFF